MFTRRFFTRFLPFLPALPLLPQLPLKAKPPEGHNCEDMEKLLAYFQAQHAELVAENGRLSSRLIKPHVAKRYTAPPILWYENAEGQQWIPTPEYYQSMSGKPEGFIYQRSQFPCEVHESCCVENEPELSHGTASWREDLVLAMAHDGYKLSEAILIAANMCSRCMNAAGADYRLGWGYARYSEQWKKANTACEFCVPV